MILIKDNHITYCGGVRQAIEHVRSYLSSKQLDLKVEIETKRLDEVRELLDVGGVDRVMLDNFTLDDLRDAINLIENRFETEASGGIRLDNIREVAETGVNYISVGAITHSAPAFDISLEAE